MKTINITFEDKDFQKLKNIKEKAGKISKARISWETFVFKTVVGSYKK